MASDFDKCFKFAVDTSDVGIEAVLLQEDNNFDKCFKFAVDTSDVGIEAVLLQEDNNGIDHPVCYFLRSLTNIRKITQP